MTSSDLCRDAPVPGRCRRRHRKRAASLGRQEREGGRRIAVRGSLCERIGRVADLDTVVVGAGNGGPAEHGPLVQRGTVRRRGQRHGPGGSHGQRARGGPWAVLGLRILGPSHGRPDLPDVGPGREPADVDHRQPRVEERRRRDRSLTGWAQPPLVQGCPRDGIPGQSERGPGSERRAVGRRAQHWHGIRPCDRERPDRRPDRRGPGWGDRPPGIDLPAPRTRPERSEPVAQLQWRAVATREQRFIQPRGRAPGRRREAVREGVGGAIRGRHGLWRDTRGREGRHGRGALDAFLVDRGDAPGREVPGEGHVHDHPVVDRGLVDDDGVVGRAMPDTDPVSTRSLDALPVQIDGHRTDRGIDRTHQGRARDLGVHGGSGQQTHQDQGGKERGERGAPHRSGPSHGSERCLGHDDDQARCWLAPYPTSRSGITSNRCLAATRSRRPARNREGRPVGPAFECVRWDGWLSCRPG